MANIYGSCWGSNASKYTIWLSWNLASQNINNNTSTINVQLYVRRNDGWASSAYNLNGRQYRCIKYDNGNVVGGNGNVDTRNGQSYLLQQATYTIPHNADGSKGITLQGEFNISGVSGISGGSVSGYITLPTIQRASHPSVNNFTLGDLITINTNRTWSGFTHNITLIINGQTIRTLEHVDNSVTVQLTDDEIESIYNSMSTQQTSTVQVNCTTYNGSTNIGTNSAYSTCSINKDLCYPIFPSKLELMYSYWKISTEFMPTFPCQNQIVDDDTIISGFGTLSGLYYREEDHLGKNGANVIKLRINLDGHITELNVTEEGGLDFYNISVPTITKNVIDLVLTVVDSRGLETSKTYKLNVSTYQSPKINSVEINRQDGISEEAYLNFSGSIWNGNWSNDELGQLKNEIQQLQFRYRFENTESDEPYTWSIWINIPNDVIVVDENNQITVSDWLMTQTYEGPPEETVAIQFPVNDNVPVQFRLSDGIYREDAFVDSSGSGISVNLDQTLGTTTYDITVDTGKFLDTVSKDYSGDYHIGVGGMPEDNYLTTFYGDVNIKGNLNIESQSERGLIKEYLLDSEQSYIEIDDLDILKDGGLYKVEFVFSCTSNDDVCIQINNISNAYHFYALSVRGSSSTNTDGTSSNSYRASSESIFYWTHGTLYSDYPSFMTMELRIIKQVDNPNLYKMHYKINYNSSSVNDNGISIMEGSNTTSIDNITSLKIFMAGNGKFNKNSRVKIYSR